MQNTPQVIPRKVNTVPHVSILIPNYNYSEYICDAIDSALLQDYPKISVIIIDDCSTDDSWDKIDKYFVDGEVGAKDDFTYKITKTRTGRVIYAIRLNQNSGPSHARNVGIMETLPHTDFYLNLDSDDVAYKNKVSMMMNYMIAIKEIAVCYADYDILDTRTGLKVREYKEPFDKLRLMQECIVHSGALIRKDVLTKVHDNFGFYDREMRTCEDYDLWMRISEQALLFHIPESLTLVRNQPMNSTNSVPSQIWQNNWYRLQVKTQSRMQNNNHGNAQQIHSTNQT